MLLRILNNLILWNQTTPYGFCVSVNFGWNNEVLENCFDVPTTKCDVYNYEINVQITKNGWGYVTLVGYSLGLVAQGHIWNHTIRT